MRDGRRTVWRARGVTALIAQAVCWLLVSCCAAMPARAQEGDGRSSPVGVIAITPIRPIPTQQDKVRLGERLFADARLSGDGTLACTSCHDLSRGGSDGQARSKAGVGLHDFNALSVFNAALNYRLNWRGDVRTLEEQNDAVVINPKLMGGDWGEILKKLAADPGYASSFTALYGPGWSTAHVLDALAEFQRSLVTPDSRFDRYLRGERGAITPAEERGFRLFESYGCISCHQGENVGGNLHQKFGIFTDPFSGRRPVTPADLGRYLLTGREEDRFVFRVPSLRNVALTAPYFHDGAVQALDQAVAIMGRTQLGRELPAAEIDLIVQFLGTLSGEYRGVPLERARESAPP